MRKFNDLMNEMKSEDKTNEFYVEIKKLHKKFLKSPMKNGPDVFDDIAEIMSKNNLPMSILNDFFNIDEKTSIMNRIKGA